MIINNESEYLIACGQLEELIDAIEDYEEKNYPIDSPVMMYLIINGMKKGVWTK